MPKGLLGKSVRQVQHMRGPIQFWVGPAREVTFQVRPRSCSHKMCPRDFLGKVEGRCNHLRGPIHFFVGSCKGGYFSGQAPKLFTEKLPEGLFGNSGKQVHYMRGPIHFLLGPAGEVIFQVRHRSCSHTMCPRDFLGKVEGRFNT